MNPFDYSALAAAVLKQKADGAGRASSLTRDSGIAVVAQAMHQSSRIRRRARRSLLATVAAAVVLTLVSSILVHRHVRIRSQAPRNCAVSDPSCLIAGGRAPAVDVGHVNGRRVLPGSSVEAGSTETVQVDFDSGTQLSLAADTSISYDQGASTRRFSLSRGSVHLRIAKLGKGERFLLTTPDAEVEVRGTVFDTSIVGPALACSHRTVVSVQEGVVEVRSGASTYTLRAGEHWPQCLTVKDAAPRQHAASTRKSRHETQTHPTEVASDAAQSAALTRTAAAAPAKEVETTNTSALGIQNDIYARACSEMKLGHTRQALASFEQLISRFPDSALIESAYAQRLRLLEQTGSSQAKDAAQQYLRRFPNGFARTEARNLLGLP